MRPQADAYAAIEPAIRQLLIAVGVDPARDGLADTPARVARMWIELLAGYCENPASHLSRTFDIAHRELILVRDIPFSSVCEHHMLEFSGQAHIAYLPGETGLVTGLSELARMVDGFARRLQVQERLTGQVADAIEAMLEPVGVLVVLDAEHLCMAMRGVRKPGSSTVTMASRGRYASDAAARGEVLGLLR